MPSHGRRNDSKEHTEKQDRDHIRDADENDVLNSEQMF